MFHIVKMTDVGNGRVNNQDSYLLKECFCHGEQVILAVMCDGMGGLRRGERASSFAVNFLEQWFDEKGFDSISKKVKMKTIKKELITAIRSINQKLILMGRTYGDSMGTTLTLLFGMGHDFFVLNIGDTRAYWFENQRMFVTKDHTLVEEEVRLGHLTRQEARMDRRRHILVQCLGVTKEIQIDCYQGKLKEGMSFLLCTDGFYNRLEEEELYQVPKDKEQMKCWVREMMSTVKARGELDNLSCMVVKVEVS
ncbi:MAG: PP2C family protein-serine/threonine phosphatase [Anaerostipes sp.]|jgi:serine/threonine protein phosphatase PrpC